MDRTLLSLPSDSDSFLELKNEGGYVYMCFELDVHRRQLYYKWRGFLLMDELNTGYNKIIELVKQYGFSSLIADHSNIVGPWNEIIDWLIAEWTPQMNKAGLKKMAIVTANDLFSNISLELFLMDNYHAKYEIKVFDTLEDAKLWASS
ncbi:MAG: hypothetical protein RMJ44_01890 [Cytophagales bacterium]|nr:STAS/SEC14 domain-containing protein [Bernardetiaceae bacterium]MDW8209813.1 hypothetical protein [Cytophagales bacterium]